MKTLKTILFIILISCKKPEKFYHPEFTQEQLQWIQNLPNPIYKVVVQKNGNITSVDTIEIQTKMEVQNKEYGFGGGGIINFHDKFIYSYYGEYFLFFRDFYIFNVKVEVTTGVEEKANFRASFYVSKESPKRNYGIGVTDINPDTAIINGAVYDSVYKWVWPWIHYDSGKSYMHTIYFKKGTGFLCIEREDINNNNDTLIYTATMIQ